MKRPELAVTEKAVLNVPEAAAYISISIVEVRRLCKIGVIKAFKTQKDWKIPRKPLDILVEQWAEQGVVLSEL